MNEAGGLRGHLPGRLLFHHDGIERCLLEDHIEGCVVERELAHVHLVPGHLGTAAVSGTHGADAH